MAQSIWVIGQRGKSGISRATREILGKANGLAGGDSSAVTGVYCGASADGVADEMAQSGAGSVITMTDPRLETYTADFYVSAISHLAGDRKPDVILIAATADGRELAAALATSFGGGAVQDCTELEWDGDTLLGTRACFGGNRTAVVENCSPGAKVFSVRPNSFPVPDAGGGGVSAEEVAPVLPEGDPRVKVLEFIPDAGGTINLLDADVIVSGGRGLGKAEGFKVIQDLADVLGGAVGASRAVVDSGWIAYPHQVGQTGKTVKPKLYIALGISGAIQHLAGMRTADTIVAVNKDENAPIFNVAHYGIVGDLFEIAPALTAKFREVLQG